MANSVTTSPCGMEGFMKKDVLGVRIWIFLVISVAGIAGCQTSTEPKAPPATEVFVPFERPVESSLPVFTKGEASFLAVDLSTGKEVSSLDPMALRTPASVTKLVSGYGALFILGPSHRFKTRVVATGPIKDGELKGDLILVGGGDPLLFVSHLMDLAFALKKKGLKKIQGRFLYDESYFAVEAAVGSLPGAEAAAYNPGFSALTLDFNRMPIHWKVDDAGRTMVYPAYPVPWTFEPAKGRSPKWKESPAGEHWSLGPSFFEDKASLPVKRAGKFVAKVFADLCKFQGIVLPTPQAGKASSKGALLAEHLSPPVEAIVESSWEYSNNLVAELLFRHALKKLGNSDDPKLLTDWLKKNVPGTDWSSVILENGSGLTTRNKVSAVQLTVLLKKMQSQSVSGRALWSRLPISGWKGTLRESFSEPDIGMRIWAKTGSLSYHAALSGFAFTDKGTPIAFAIFLSDEKGRQKFESAVVNDDESYEEAPREWGKEARAFQDRLLTYWIKRF